MIDFFDFINEMLCVADERGYFVRVNRAWTTTLGWSVEELTGRPYVEYVHPDDVASTLRAAEALFGSRNDTVCFENRYRARDGGYRWLAWQARFDPDTNKAIGTARDVTQEKLKSEALRASEERFRTLADHAPIGIAQANAEGEIFYVNTKWCDLSGITRQEALGFSWKDSIHPQDLDQEIDRWRTALQAGEDLPAHELRFLHRNGQIRWALISVALLKGAAGEVVGQIATVEDITERKDAEMALREAEQRFRAFMDNNPAIAWSKDEHGRIVFLNQTCEQYMHFQPADWFGKTDFDIWPAEIAKRLQANDRRVLQTGQPIKVFEETASAEHERCWWMTILFPYQDRQGQTFIGGIAMDISDLKRAETALQAKQDLLRNLIEVQENEKQRLCHEFHDGLLQYAIGTMMSLESYLLNHRSELDSELIERAIGDLRKGIEDGRRTIRGIRPAVLDDSDLNAAIHDLIDQLAPSGILVNLDCPPEIGRLPDSVQTTLYRIVQEALNNARKYSGTDVVRVTLRKTDEDLRLEVCDYGCGFDVGTARKQGFGLLGMTERVRLLGGDVCIQSERDRGTTISVRVPIAVSKGDSDAE